MGHKWRPEGEPEGFIHFADGRVEGYHENTAERADVDGSWGWCVTLYAPTWIEPNVFMLTSTGYDESGNRRGVYPSADRSPKILVNETDPDRPTTSRFDEDYGYEGWIRGWFPTEAEAQAFAQRLKDLTEMVQHARETAEEIVVRAASLDELDYSRTLAAFQYRQ